MISIIAARMPLRAREGRLALARTALALLATLWAGSLPLAALAAGHFEEIAPASRVFSLAIYDIGSLVCHQRPERSFHLGQAPLPVCARCSGLYLGAAVTAVVVCGLSFTGWKPERVSGRFALSTFRIAGAQAVFNHANPAAFARFVLIVAAFPLLLTLVYEWSSGRVPSNDMRALTGALLGAGIAWVLLDVE